MSNKRKNGTYRTTKNTETRLKKGKYYVYSTLDSVKSGWYKGGITIQEDAIIRVEQQDKTSNYQKLNLEFEYDLSPLIKKGINIFDIEEEIKDYLVINKKIEQRKDKKREWFRTYGILIFKEAIAYIFKKYNVKKKEQQIKHPNEWQNEFLPKTENYFQKYNRGYDLITQRAGKTLHAYFGANIILKNISDGNGFVVWAFPNLYLIKQTVREIKSQQHLRGKEFTALCVCSDENIAYDEYTDLKGKVVKESLNDNPLHSTTNIFDIQSWIESVKEKKETKYIFVTYQSGDILTNALNEINCEVDLLIQDEFHRTIGRKNGLFAYMTLNLKKKKQWSLSASKKKISKRIKNEELHIDIDSKEIYGNLINELPYREAVERGIVLPYEIVLLDITKQEIKEFIKENKWLTIKNIPEEYQTRFVASILALEKAYSKKICNKVISFHSTNNYAQRFEYAIKKLSNSYSHYFPSLGKIKTYNTKGGQSEVTERTLQWFSDPKNGQTLITNCRVLGEGIDSPGCDGVIFVDPRISLIAMDQAKARCVTKDPNNPNKKPVIILPVVVDDGNIIEESYDMMVTTLCQLKYSDKFLDDEVKAIMDGIKKPTPKPVDDKKISKVINLSHLNIKEIDLSELYSTLQLMFLGKNQERTPERVFEEVKKAIEQGLTIQEWKRKPSEKKTKKGKEKWIISSSANQAYGLGIMKEVEKMFGFKLPDVDIKKLNDQQLINTFKEYSHLENAKGWRIIKKWEQNPTQFFTRELFLEIKNRGLDKKSDYKKIKLKQNYTLKQCKEEAKDYNSRYEFSKKSKIYNYAWERGWLDKICQHMDISFTFKECEKEAKNYDSRIEFECGNASMYNFAKDKGWLDKIDTHMIKRKAGRKKGGKKITSQDCWDAAHKCKTKSEFTHRFGSERNAAKKMEILDKIYNKCFPEKAEKGKGYLKLKIAAKKK